MEIPHLFPPTDENNFLQRKTLFSWHSGNLGNNQPGFCEGTTLFSIAQSYKKHPPGHGVGALVVLASPSVAAVRLDQVLKTRDSKLDAVVAAQASDRRQLSTLWQAHLVPDQRVRLGDRQL